MFSIISYLFEEKKEVFVGLSLSILYLTYYLFEVVKKPVLVCREGPFREFLEQNIKLLHERYWPTPWCVESRLQTVLGSILRSSLLPPISYRREVLRMSDGGQVALDWLDATDGRDADSVLVVLPGLTGGSQADYVKCLVSAAHHMRMDCVVFNNRGQGGLQLTSPRLYCAVSHADLAEVVAWVRRRRPGAALLAAGVSLGGLILGNYLAAEGERAAVRAAFIVSSPLNVPKGSECIERPYLNALLSYHMARNLRNTLTSHAPLRDVRGPWDWGEVAACRSVRQFDAAFTTKHFGFGDVEAYYRAASLHDKLSAVRVPLLCLCAADDPFQPLEAIPVAEARASGSVALVLTARGGHIGFMEGVWPARAPHLQYMSRLAAQFFGAVRARPAVYTPRD